MDLVYGRACEKRKELSKEGALTRATHEDGRLVAVAKSVQAPINMAVLHKAVKAGATCENKDYYYVFRFTHILDDSVRRQKFIDDIYGYNGIDWIVIKNS